MSPERRAAYVQQSREELAHLSRQGYHAAGWALEAIDTLACDLAHARRTGLFFSQGIPVPADQEPVSALQMANPVKPKKRPLRAG
jgi:hypothetical protein